MKELKEVEGYRNQTAKEIDSINNIIFKMQERIEIPSEAKRLGFETYMVMLMTKKTMLEVIKDTLDWTIGE